MTTERMVAPQSLKDVLHVSLDFRTEQFTSDEREATLEWYRKNPGEGDRKLAQFVDFLLDYYPAGLKRFRRNAIETGSADNQGDGLPAAAPVLMILNLYAYHHRERETFYELILLKNMGVSKAEILDTLRFSFIMAGPAGLNAVAERGKRFLDDWVDEPRRRTIAWPTGWQTGSGGFDSGLDAGSLDLPLEEQQAIRKWHMRTSGDVPSHVDLLCRFQPSAYKGARLRMDNIFEVLPAQMVPLFTLHLATYNVWPSIVRRAAKQALGLGVRKCHLLQTILFGAQDGGEWKLEAAINSITDLLDDSSSGECRTKP
jgi:hypothetical protein